MTEKKKTETATKIRPIGDRLVVKQFAAAEKSKGGIIIPAAAKEKPTEGEVLAVGEGRYNDKGEYIPIAVKAGDKVLFNKFAGNIVLVAGEEYIIIRENDVLGILDQL